MTVPYGYFSYLNMVQLVSSEKPPATTARQDQRRDAILAVAREVFNAEGYATASMSAIAAKLGGSKGTLYNYFPSKEALFEACIHQQCARFADGLFDMPDDQPVADVLVRFGMRFLDHLFSDWAVRMFQIIVAEAHRSPELTRIFYDAGPAVGLRGLQAYIERAVAAGRLAASDCAVAAAQFHALCRGHSHLVIVLGLAQRPSDAAIAQDVARAVEMFMARYGAAGAR